MPTPLSNATAWWQAARPAAYGMIGLPLLWGQALALFTTQKFEWHWFWLILVFGAACQIHILYLNDYADEAVDNLNKNYWLSGGSRVIPDGLLNGKQLYKASFVALGIMLLLALVAAYFGRLWMLPLAALVGLLGWGYSLRPLQSSYRGFGELHQAIGCGLLLPVTAYYLQSGDLTLFPWLAVLPIMMLFYAGNIVTALLDTPADTLCGKRTYPVRHGETKARKSALLILATAYISGFIVTATSQSMAWSTVLIFLPSMGLLLYSMYTGLLSTADSANRVQCKRFVILTSASQVWVMTLWTGAIFWRAI
jgi:1,4-dihydroxy-2-naphthoate octaprenyltransferase